VTLNGPIAVIARYFTQYGAICVKVTEASRSLLSATKMYPRESGNIRRRALSLHAAAELLVIWSNASAGNSYFYSSTFSYYYL